jgi:hypothetical protein
LLSLVQEYFTQDKLSLNILISSPNVVQANNSVNIKRILLASSLWSLSVFGFFKVIEVSNARPISKLSEVEFFKGTWKCQLKKSATAFSWSVTNGLGGTWLTGFVQVGQDKVTNDYWRINNGKIERYAFTTDALVVKVESNGWQGNKLTFAGTFNKPGEELQTRETITKVSDREFLAVWEKMDKSQRWSILSEESCVKQ